MRITIAALALLHFSGQATPYSSNVDNDYYHHDVNVIPTARDHNDGVPDLFDAMNMLLGTRYQSNAELDNRFVANDQLFVGEGSQSVALVGLTAGNHNTLGIYTDVGVGQEKTAILPSNPHYGFMGDGSANQPFAGVSLDIMGEFGWYLEQSGPVTYSTFYSENQLNGGWDHTMTFAIPELNGQSRYLDLGDGIIEYTFSNAYLIGWEDLPFGFFEPDMLGDDDYDDLMYLVDFKPASINKPVDVSEPLSGVLLASGLLGCCWQRSKRRILRSFALPRK
ncbi:hypothetical protein [Agarivorans sp. 1_MG-2023]|uniref:hypothetical protein n=1 Tax=Agarivorans sp. 1_MG-2023 TaxID=3062634 RepID=UPI0026E14E34|nr:hypothetical protein [Agarivorans sp. 1_MG-2023]MDO6762574.1 hypothetical protein [Agarivorans sp. 1_MG-2023]